MASFSLSRADVFPVGTDVDAYERADWLHHQPLSGEPPGTAVDTQTVDAAGSATFTGLDDDTRYVAAAEVSGAWRYVQFRTPAVEVENQPLDADLTAIAAQTTTAAGRSTLDDATVAAIRTTLGLGGIINVKTDHAAAGNGTDDDFAEIQAAIDAAETLATSSGGVVVVVFPPGTYKITDTLTVQASNVQLHGPGATLNGSTIASAAALAQRYAIRVQGTIGSTVSLSDVAVGATTLTGTTTGIVAGDVLLVKSTQKYLDGASGSSAGVRGELKRVQSITDGSNLVTTEPTFFSYANASSATMQEVTMLAGFVMHGLSIVMGGTGDAHNGVNLQYCQDPIISKVSIDGCEDTGVTTEYCWGATVRDCFVQNCTSPGGAIGNTGYGVTFEQASRNCIVDNCRFYNCRHAVAGGGSPTSHLCTVSNNKVERCGHQGTTGGLDAHEEAFWWTFLNNQITGCYIGLDIRGQGCKAIGNTIRHCNGAGIRVESFDVNSDGNLGPTLIGNFIEYTGSHGIWWAGTTDTRIKGGVIDGNTIRRATGNHITVWLSDDLYIGNNEYDVITSFAGNDGNNIRLVGTGASDRSTNVRIVGGNFRSNSARAVRADHTSGLRCDVGLPVNGCRLADCLLVRRSPVVLAESAVAVVGPADTSENTLATVTVPAGSMGLNGRLRITCLFSYTNNANTKTMRVRFNGTNYAAPTATTSANHRFQQEIANRNSEASQIAGPMSGAGSSGWGVSSGSLNTSTHATTSDQNITLTAQLGVGTDTITLEHYLVELLPG